MPSMHEVVRFEAERAVLVAAMEHRSRPLMSMQDSLAELALLASTAGIDVVGQTTQVLRQIEPATYIGSGKLEEVRDLLVAADARVVI